MSLVIDRRSFIAGLATLVSAPTLVSASEKTAVIFVGASWCHVCKNAAPYLALYAQNHGLPVLVASADARPITPFPSFSDASKHPVASKIRVYPTTLIYSSELKGIIGSFEGFKDPAWYVGQLQRLIQLSEV